MNLKYKFHRWIHGELMWRKWSCNEEDQSYTKGGVEIVLSDILLNGRNQGGLTIPGLDIRTRGDDIFYVFPRAESSGGHRSHAEWRTRRDWRCAITRKLTSASDYNEATLMPLEGLRTLLDALGSPEDVPALAGLPWAAEVMESLLKI